MKNIDNTDKLKDLFRQIKLEDPTPDFEVNLMNRIQKEAVSLKRKRHLSHNITFVISICAGILGLIGIPAILLPILDPEINLSFFGDLNFSFFREYDPANLKSAISSFFKFFEINPFITMIGFTILILLVADLFIRKFIHERSSNHIPHSA